MKYVLLTCSFILVSAFFVSTFTSDAGAFHSGDRSPAGVIVVQEGHDDRVADDLDKGQGVPVVKETLKHHLSK